MFFCNLAFEKYLGIIVLLFLSESAFAFEHIRRVNSSNDSDCQYDLHVDHDGPVTLDVPITFSAFLTCAIEDEEYMYIFKDNANPQHQSKVYGNKTANISIIYPEDMYHPGEYMMEISSFMMVFGTAFLQVASTSILFHVYEYIPGALNMTGVTKRAQDDENQYIATGKVTNISVTLYYPHQVYEESEMSYSWTIDKDQFITTVPYNSYIFSLPGDYKVHVAAVARIPLYDKSTRAAVNIKYKWGYFNQKIVVKDPFHTINLTGNTYLKHGQLFNLDVSCNGSGPFEYCWKIFQPSENLTNLTCASPVVTTQCSFPIIYYFHESGDYQVAIYVDNFVSALQRNVEVHIYDVSLRPQLSTVIMPLFCTVLVILIIAAGVVIHVRQNQQIDIETADFDFLQSEACVLETFWERLHRSILRVLCLNKGMSKPPLYITNGEMANLPRKYDSVNP